MLIVAASGTEWMRAAAEFAWPVVATMAIFIFRSDIQGLLKRVVRGRLLGQEFELTELQDIAKEAEDSVVEIEPADPQEQAERRNVEETILREATHEPTLSLIRLAAAIERELRVLGASLGLPAVARPRSVHHSVDILEKRGAVPASTASAVRVFWNVRNQLVHGGEASKAELLTAVDIGLSILRTLQAVPRETHRVLHPRVELFEDAEGQGPRRDVHGVVLTSDRGSVLKPHVRVFPTTHNHFRKGSVVAWDWNPGRSWDETWYRDPSDGSIKHAWSSSMEFVGDHVD